MYDEIIQKQVQVTNRQTKITSCFQTMKLIILILLVFFTNQIYGSYHRDLQHVSYSGPRIIPSKSNHNITFAIKLKYILFAVQRMSHHERPYFHAFVHLNALIKKIQNSKSILDKLRNRAKFVRLF